MGRYCSDCTYLKSSDKKYDGCYKCTKVKKYMFGNTPACPKFDNAYSRRAYDKEKLYDLGVKTEKNSAFSDKPSSGILLLLFFLLVIIRLFIYFFLKY